VSPLSHHLQGAPPPDGATKQVLRTLLTKKGGRRRIRCPKCAWRPRKRDRWFCTRCEQATWNTFDTRGVCPVCAYHWRWTMCLACHQWSPHEDWYEKTE